MRLINKERMAEEANACLCGRFLLVQCVFSSVHAMPEGIHRRALEHSPVSPELHNCGQAL